MGEETPFLEKPQHMYILSARKKCVFSYIKVEEGFFSTKVGRMVVTRVYADGKYIQKEYTKLSFD